MTEINLQITSAIVQHGLFTTPKAHAREFARELAKGLEVFTNQFASELEEQVGTLNALYKRLYSYQMATQCLSGASLSMQPIMAESAIDQPTEIFLSSLAQLRAQADSNREEALTKYHHQYTLLRQWIEEKTGQLISLPFIEKGSEFSIDSKELFRYKNAFLLSKQFSKKEIEANKEAFILLVSIANNSSLLHQNPLSLLFVLRMKASYNIHLPEELTSFLKEKGPMLLMQAKMSYENILMDEVWLGFETGNASAFCRQLREFNYFSILFPNACKWLEHNSISELEKKLSVINSLPPEERKRDYIFGEVLFSEWITSNEEPHNLIP